MYNAHIEKLSRQFLPEDFRIQTFNDLKPFYEQLLSFEINHVQDLVQWLKQWSELQSVISEDICWRQIKMTCDTENKKLEEAFHFFCLEIEPLIKPFHDQLNRKLLSCKYLPELNSEEYMPFIRSVKNEVELFREENVPLHAELNVLAQQYGTLTGKMTIEFQNKELTLQQASAFLSNPDRLLREEVFRKVAVRRQQDEKALDDLMDQLISIRHQVARNAGFDNYRDYKFRELGRFDYTVNDCMQFHQSVKECILPLVDAVFAEKKKVLGIPELKPWDTDAEPAGREPLKPFTDGSELLAKSIAVFDRLMPFLAQCLTKMKQLGHFDLDSRKGKAPGGYNCPLAETGAPFIFMNAAGTADDVVTMMHEGGHAIHSFLCHPLPLNAFKEYPMEMAELASMSMELFSMEHWDVFYPGATELKRAQAEELERILIIFPWIACIDEFQHWMYTHPEHTAQERKEKWVSLHRSYQSKELNWQDMEDYRTILWQKQLHLFEVPFYYIEYGIAQLGAIALWMNFRKNPFGTLNSYLQALSKGYTMDLKKLYQTAGIPFDMSRNRIQELSDFTFERLTELYQ